MADKPLRILVINTGSTSTKLAQFEDTRRVVQTDLTVPMEKLKGKNKAIEQLQDRIESVREHLAGQGKSIRDFDIVSARGGPMPPCEGGAYLVNELMLDVLRYAPLSQHESALSCMIGYELTRGTQIPTIVYDGINSDEFKEEAKWTGVAGIRFLSRGHVLNSRQVGHVAARDMGKQYRDCRFIIAHFGGSFSVSSHEFGRITDMYNAFNGPMSPQRAGMVPTTDVVELCFSGRYNSAAQVERLLNKESGLMGYLGTQDGREAMSRYEKGEEAAVKAIRQMAYQSAKAIGGLAAGMNGKVDAILYTGGLAHSREFTDLVTERVSFIAPVKSYPGEFEMEALAAGAVRVMRGEEKAKEYTALPKQFADRESFYAYVNRYREESGK